MTDQPTTRPGRNEPCHCGSGKKYKHCCLAKDEEEDRARRADEAAAAPPAPEHDHDHEHHAEHRRHRDDQPWRRGAANTKGFRTFSGPRKVGS